MLAADYLTATGEHRDVLNAYRMFAHDKGWVRRMESSIDSGLAAEVAVEKEQSATRARMSRAADPYIRERLHDLDDLSNRLLRLLSGGEQRNGRELPDDAILVARNIGPGELLDYGRKLRGVVLEEGSVGSHAAIVARALAIPLVIQAARITREAMNGDPILVDGDQGHVHLRPEETVAKAFREKVDMLHEAQAAYAALARQAGDDARRGDAAPAHERRPDGRPAEPAEMRRARGRPVPHRAAVPRPHHRAEAQRARRALCAHPRLRPRQAGGVPHPRHRLRQGAALHEARRRAEPGARLAGDPGRARPARHHADAGAGADPRRQGPAAADHVPLRRPRPASSRPAARWSCASSSASAALGRTVPRKPEDRRDARDPEPRLRAGPLLRAGRLHLDRRQRPQAVLLRRRPRERAGPPPLRHAEPELPRAFSSRSSAAAPPTARRSRSAARMPGGRSRRWRWPRSAFAACRCGRPRSVR